MDPISLLRGPLTFLSGVRWILTHPRYLFLGALPAAGAAGLLILALILLTVFSGSIAGLLAPLTAGLLPWLAVAIAAAFQVALIAGGAVLAYVLFAALALAIGDPIYSKIAGEIEAERGGELPDTPWKAGLKDAFLLVAKGAGVAFLAFIIGLIPAVGGFLAFAITWLFLPFLISEELLGRTLVPKGILAQEKTDLLLKDKGAVWSFGVCSQLLFTIPILSVILMPATVAGASLLSQELLRLSGSTEANK